MKGILLSFLSFVMVVGSASAADLKIIDSTGLTRALKSISDSATVKISIGDKKASKTTSLTLRNENGLSADISGLRKKQDFVFSGVTSGTWRVISPGDSPAITTVKID